MPESAFVIATPGQIVAGRYRIQRLLARGGHGAVFVAEQLSTEARVALKMLLPHVLDDTEVRQRFELEAKIASRIASEYVVRTLDAGVDERTGLPFIAMELLEGSSLADAVRQGGPWSPLDTATCLLQVAQGLDKAHGARHTSGALRSIVHRDLKPENLFLTLREDGQRVVKILDFGTAKVLSESFARSRTIHGSPLYMAYEQLSGGAISPRTDVWALGLIAFFLLTGRSYWRSAESCGANLSAIFAEVLHMPIVRPSARARELRVAPSWPVAFDEWFLRCVNRDPAARFATAGHAGRSLLEALLAPEERDSISASLTDLPQELALAVGETQPIGEVRRASVGVRSVATMLVLGLIAGGAVSMYAVARHEDSAGSLRASLALVSRSAHQATTRPQPPAAPAVSAPTSVMPRARDPHPRARVRVATPASRQERERKSPAAEATTPAPSHILNSPTYSER
ncbi:MAG TPA: serine/threonine-protein kinase [Polyangiaceae bacterium]